MFALPPHVTASLDSRSKFKSEVLPQVAPVQASLNSQSGGCQLSYSLVSVALTRNSVTCTPTLPHSVAAHDSSIKLETFKLWNILGSRTLMKFSMAEALDIRTYKKFL